MQKPLLLSQLPPLPPNFTPPLTFQAPASVSPIPAPPNSSLFVQVTTMDTCPACTVQMVGYRNNGERWIQTFDILSVALVAVQTASVPVPVGSIASVTIVTTTTSPQGKVFGVCWIAPTNTLPPNITQGICRGWVSTYPSCAYPSPGWPTLVELEGPPVLYTIPAPGLGLPATLQCVGFTGTLYQAYTVFQTSAAVGNRSMRIRILNAGGERVNDIISSVIQAPSTTEAYNFGAFGSDLQTLTGNVRVVMGPVVFTSLNTISFNPNNLDAGDNMINCTLILRLIPEIV